MVRWRVFQRWLLVPLLILAWSGAARADEKVDPAVDEVIQCVRRNVPKQSSASDARLVSTDPAGGSREFEARFLAKRMPDGLRRAKICVTAPPDLRGAQVLAMENLGRLPDSFLYTEELRVPKRITGSGLGAGIFGTDLTFEDFERFMSLNRVEATRRLPDAAVGGRAAFVLESTPFHPDRSHYSKATSWVDKETCVIVRAEFYEGQAKPRRVLEADPVEIVTTNGFSYPGILTVKDLADGSETRVEVTAAEIDGARVTDRELEVGELGRYCR